MDEVVKLVGMHDGNWEHSQGYPHVFVPLHGRVEVGVFDVNAHELAFFG